MNHPIEKIVDLFEKRGAERYADEEVTQLQHALQCAKLASQAGESDVIIAAALLHDIGHILGPDELPADCQTNLDDAHEKTGYAFLSEHFGPEIAVPVFLHVAAKRYLCTTNSTYMESLSPTSCKSLADQGGLMNPGEVSDFKKHPYFAAAVQLRRWDDLAKDTTWTDIDISEFLPHLEVALNAFKQGSSESGTKA